VPYPLVNIYRLSKELNSFIFRFRRKRTRSLTLKMKALRSLNTKVTKGKSKAVPLQAWNGLEGSRELRFPDFMTTAHDGSKVVSLRHRPPLPLGNTPGTHFCWRLSRPQGHSATGRIMSLKNSNDTIGYRTRDLPFCRLVP